jgi:hypothetical protein
MIIGAENKNLSILIFFSKPWHTLIPLSAVQKRGY